MDRRKATALAGIVALSITGAGAAMALNVGLLGSSGTSDVGQLDASNITLLADEVVQPTGTETTDPSLVPTTPPTTTVYVDEYVTLPAGDSVAPGAPATAGGALASTPPAAFPSAPVAPAPAPSPAAAPTQAPTEAPTPTAPHYSDDDSGEHADEDEHGDEYEAPEHGVEDD